MLERARGKKAFFTEKYNMPGYTVWVMQEPPLQQYIKIIQTHGMKLEFAASGKPIIMDTSVLDPSTGLTVPNYRGVIVSATFKPNATKTGLVAKAEIAGQKRTLNNGIDTSPLGRQYMVDMWNEPVAQRGKRALFESWAPKHAHTGYTYRGTAFYANQGGGDLGQDGSAAQRDIGYDVPHEFTKGLEKVTRSYLIAGFDWPRACGYQVVTTNLWGQREFAIYIDGHNKVGVYPIDAITHVDGYTQNVSGTYVKTAQVVMPGGMVENPARLKDSISSSENMLVDLIETDWKVNHLGTKMCAIGLTKAPFLRDAAYWGSNASTTPYTTGIHSDVQSRMGRAGRGGMAEMAPGHNPTCYFWSTGIVEVELKIALTGPDLEDFTFSIVTTMLRDPATTTRYAWAVGYSWHDFGPTVKAGDLITYEWELYMLQTGSDSAARHNSAQNLATGRPWLAETFFTVHNWTQNYAELKCMRMNPADGIIALDTETCAFVIQQTPFHRYTNFSDSPLYTGTFTQYFGVSVFVGFKHQETLWPELSSGWPDRVKPDILLAATQNERAYIDKAITYWATTTAYYPGDLYATPMHKWEYVPLNDAYRDSWNSQWTDCREVWSQGNYPYFYYGNLFAFYMAEFPPTEARFYNGNLFHAQDHFRKYEHEGGGHVPDPTIFDNMDDFFWASEQLQGFSTPAVTPGAVGLAALAKTCHHLLLCSTPYWGRHAYTCITDQFVQLSGNTTFFAHANGSYALWENALIYFGVPSPLDLEDVDVSLVEHCVFDRIVVWGTGKYAKSAVRTSFMELYNQAVAAGVAADTLEANILPMTKADQRATFVNNGVTSLVLDATWDSDTYEIIDTSYYPAAQFGMDPANATFTTYNLNFNTYWDLPTSRIPAMDKNNPHIRFSNPYLVTEAL